MSVAVVGAAMTQFGKHPSRTLRSLANEAVNACMADASIGPETVGGVFFANAVAGLITGQEMIRGQVALRDTGLLGIPIFNVENACASGASAFHLAWATINGGLYDVAIAVGAEKLCGGDTRTALDAIGTAVDLEEADDLGRWARRSDAPDGSIFMNIYAAKAREYSINSGATSEDFALVAVKNHEHGALNEKAQYRDQVSVEQVLSSRMIADPLTLLMCSPVSDGAAAVVLASERAIRRLSLRVLARVLSSVVVSGDGLPGHSPVARAADHAYSAARISPHDLDFVELHDGAAAAELMVYEELGLADPGEGPALLRSGATRLGGRIPVNSSGGLLAKGHPVGATGLAQIVELADQLGGRAGHRQIAGARLGLAENGGGFLGRDVAVASVVILER